MLKNYLKIILRNFWKNKTLSLISILGLSIGLSIFIIGLLYLNYEWNYDKGFTDYRNIYRIEMNYADGHVSVTTPQPLCDLFKERVPEIEGLTKFRKDPLLQPLLKVNDNNIFVDDLFYADSSFFRIFDFPFIYGSIQNAFSKPNSIVLSKETAYKLFKNINPVGKPVMIGSEGNFTPFIVTGVFNDQKFPTHLSMDAIRLMEYDTKDINLWKSNYTYIYLKLNPRINISTLERKMTSLYANAMPKTYVASFKNVALNPISNIYLHSHTKEEISKKGSETVIWLIACLVIFMLIVSAINFTNLTIANAPSRAKEIAIRKFVGSSRFSILKQLYLEILVKCFVALIIAFVIIELILPAFSNVLSTRLSLFENSNFQIWLQIAGLLITIVLVAGTFPVLYISYFKPVAILKGNFIQSPKGNSVRNALLIIQFMITSVFITGIFIISNQVKFLRTEDLGFNPQQVVILIPGQFGTQFNYPEIQNKLSKIPGVQSISYASAIGQPNEQTTLNLIVNGEEYTPQYVCVDTGYFNVMGAHIISGRNFSAAFSDSLNAIIINRELSNELGIKKPDSLDDIKAFKKSFRIIGIVDDLNFYGFENKIGPMVFTTTKLTLTPFILIKLNTTNISFAIQSIQNEWRNVEPGYPLRYQFLDETFGQLYNNYERLNKIFTYFSICALLIALIGLFALTRLIAAQRSREIAIRKVLGASINDILKLLNTNFFRLTIIANVLAWPITFLLAQNWLNNFAYRIKIPVAPFVIATIISLTLTIFTVSIQALKTASLNPVDKLKQE